MVLKECSLWANKLETKVQLQLGSRHRRVQSPIRQRDMLTASQTKIEPHFDRQRREHE